MPAPSYDADLDGIGSILHDLCELVVRSPGAEFVAGGFGQERWPAQACHFCIILEQMPEVVDALVTGADSFQIDFVEQGCLRFLYFERRGALFDVMCTSGDDWTPSPAEEVVATDELATMLRQFLESFIGFSRSACPESVQHPWFQQWLGSVAPLLGVSR